MKREWLRSKDLTKTAIFGSVKDAVGWEKSFKNIEVTNIDTDKPTASVHYSTPDKRKCSLYITASDTMAAEERSYHYSSRHQ